MTKKNAKSKYLPLSFNTVFEYADTVGMRNFLKSLSDINAQDKSGMTGLMFAARYGDLPTVEYCIKNGANANLQNIKGDTAIMFAVENNRNDIEYYLLTHCDIDLDIVNKAGKNVFDIAGKYGSAIVQGHLYEHLLTRYNDKKQKLSDANVITK